MVMITQITRNTSEKDIIKLAPACDCDQCRHGCRMGSGLFAQGEIGRLAKFLNMDVEDLKKNHLEEAEQFGKTLHRPKIKRDGKPYGQCTFFDEKKGCTIHEVKPLQCKIAMGCKEYGQDLMLWFMLSHIIDKDDPSSIRQYAAYLKSGGKTLPGGKLGSLVPDKKKLQQMLDYEK
jgi:Fe-S-cluster containining protein